MGATEQTNDVPAKPSIPPVVYAGAALLSLFALVVAVLVGIIAAALGREAQLLALGPIIGGMMLGQGLEFGGAIVFGPSISSSIAFLPFGVIVPAAFVLQRIGFTSAWLRVRSARFLPALAGGVAAFVVALLLTRPSGADYVGFDFRFFVEPAFRPGWAFLAGAAPWLFAVLMANHAPSRDILRGLLVLQGLFIVLIAGFFVYVAVREEGITDIAFLVGAFFGAMLGAIPIVINTIAITLVAPFGGAIGARTTDFSTDAEGLLFLLRQDPSSARLWGIVLIAVGSVVLLGWRIGPSSDLRSALLGIRSTLIGATAVVLPILLLGRIYGSFAAELGLLGSGRSDFSASFGSAGLALRWPLILLLMALVLLITQVVVAQRAGLSWASNENLTTQGQALVRTTSGTLRGAAERARLAAEAATAAVGTPAQPKTQPEAQPASHPEAQPASHPDAAPDTTASGPDVVPDAPEGERPSSM